MNDLVYIKFNSEIKEIKTDLCNTGLEFLQQFQKEPVMKPYASLDVKYNAFYKNRLLKYSDFLINLGIKGNKNEDLIEVNLKDNFKIIVKTLMGRKATITVQKSDTVAFIKYLNEIILDIPQDEQELIFEQRGIGDNKTLADYNIKEGSILCVILRLRGGRKN